MEKNYYLAIDIGASSGRHMLAWFDENSGKIGMEEIYRFPNGLVDRDGHKCWDVEALWGHILEGIRAAVKSGRSPRYLGIDTWGVDFVLLDKNDQLIGNAVGYRDGRTAGMDEVLSKILPDETLYARTGIQKQIFNTIYQLTALKQQNPEQLEKAEAFLMMPDYLNFRLTGVKEQEYTNASTTQLLNMQTADWDRDLLKTIGIPDRLFGKLAMPGTTVGQLKPEIAEAVGCQLTVLHPASHDTGSAVLAVPTSRDDVAYLSSGTWSLLGVESLTPFNNETARRFNLTNEGGYDHRYRCLRNIMGLWIIQSIKRECDGQYSFDQLCEMARSFADTKKKLDVNDPSFLMPDSMIGAIRAYFGEPEMPLGEILATVYQGLADCYAETIRSLSALVNHPISALHIIGGGSKDAYLNELTSAAAGIPVFAGPTEATAIGNILAQMLGTGVFSDLPAARRAVFDSFEVRQV